MTEIIVITDTVQVVVYLWNEHLRICDGFFIGVFMGISYENAGHKVNNGKQINAGLMNSSYLQNLLALSD